MSNIKPKRGPHGKIPIDYDQLKSICRMNPSLKDCADFFKCSEDTIERRCEEFEGVGFKEFRDRYLIHTKLDLQRKAFKMAETNPTMMIFALKNYCGWTDKVETTHKSDESGGLIINLKPVIEERKVNPELEGETDE